MSMLDRVNRAATKAFEQTGRGDPMKDNNHLLIDYLLWMNVDDAKELYDEIDDGACADFEDFITNSSVRVDAALPQGKIEVEFRSTGT